MKKNVLWMLAAILTCGLTMTSCATEDNPVGRDESKGKKLTILYYGNAGGDLDDCLLGNIRDMYLAGDKGVYDQLNICVQYKNSAKFAKMKGKTEQYYLDEIETAVPGFKFEKGNTYRFLLDPAKGYSKGNPQMQLTDDNIYGGKGNMVDMGDENTLLDFLNWAKENCPAENYMLIMNDHGGGYMPDDDLPKKAAAGTRGIIYDEGFNQNLTLPGIAKALKQAGIKFQAIYFDVCLMNNLEYLYELSSLTDYVMASTYTTQGKGGDYKSLYKELATNSNFVKAIENYYDVVSKRWTNSEDPKSPSYDDNSLTETAELIKAAPAIKAFVDQLCDSYTNGTKSLKARINDATENVFKVDASKPYYDITDYLARIYLDKTIEKEDEKLSNAAFEAYRAVGSAVKAQAASYYTDMVAKYRPGYSVMLAQQGSYYITTIEDDAKGVAQLLEYTAYNWDGTAQDYEKDGDKYKEDGIAYKWGSTGAATYEQLQFDKLTGWSRWLKLNTEFPNYDTIIESEWMDSYVAPNNFIE